MSDFTDRINEEFDTLRTVRDELRVQMNLAAAEAKDRYEGLENQWEHAEAKLKLIADESKDSADNVAEALKVVAEEIKTGYEQIRRLL